MFFSWECGLAFADEVMHMAIQLGLPDAQRLSWLRARDEQARADVARYVCDGWPGGEALQKAREDQSHYWRMGDAVAAMTSKPTREARESSPPRNTARGGKGGGKGQKQQKGTSATISQDKKGIHLCGAFNSHRGCTRSEWDCPQGARHACSYAIGKGTPCGRRDHGACSHEKMAG